MTLSVRQRQTLEVMAAEERLALFPGRIAHLYRQRHGGNYRQRADAGMTRTLDSLERLGLVRGSYEWEATGRSWELTDKGRAEVGAT